MVRMLLGRLRLLVRVAPSRGPSRLMIHKFLRAWNQFVSGSRVALAAIFLPVMVFGFVVFPEVRVVTAVAIFIQSVILVRHVRSRKTSHAMAARASPIESPGQSLSPALLADFAKLWRISLAVFFAQGFGAILCWYFSSTHELMDLLKGGMSSSIVGLGVGIAWDRSCADMWSGAPSLVRMLYQGGAAIMTLVGIGLFYFL